MSKDKPGFFSRENITDHKPGSGFNPQSLMNRQIAAIGELHEAQLETNRLLAELLARLPQRGDA